MPNDINHSPRYVLTAFEGGALNRWIEQWALDQHPEPLKVGLLTFSDWTNAKGPTIVVVADEQAGPAGFTSDDREIHAIETILQIYRGFTLEAARRIAAYSSSRIEDEAGE